MKPILPDSLRNWPSTDFKQILKDEIERLPAGTLPLNKGTTLGGYVDDDHITASVLNTSEDDLIIHARVSIFFTEIMICCGCGDDPMPQNAYCEMQVTIDKSTAEATFNVDSD